MPNTTTYSLGFSPCPNDCFIFDALLHQKIDTEGLTFNPVIADVEALNKMAFSGELDITKLSFHAYVYLVKSYQLLHSGSALGFNCGPLLITASEKIRDQLQALQKKPANALDDTIKIGIPGKYTTANFLLSIAFPQLKNKTEMLFSSIEDALLSGQIDAGLIIHENRFTYERKGLKKIMDLGEYWEELIKAPIPLGGIVVKRNINKEQQKKIDRVLRRSIEYAFKHPESPMNFVKGHAQEMEEAVMKKHIQLYVNNYSVELGETGRQAVELLFNKAEELNLIQKSGLEKFV